MVKMQRRNRMKSLGIFLLFTLIVISGHAPDVQAEGQGYLFGLAPMYEKQVVEEGFKPLVNFLEKVVESPLKLVTTDSFEELIEKIISNEVQFALLGPAQYVETKWRYPELVYLATTQTTQQGQQRAYYFGHIIVHKNSGITDLSQLENMSFAFIDPYSTSGYRFPRMHLYKRGIKPEKFFSKVIFAGNHEKAVTREFIENELQGEAFTVTGNMTGRVEDMYYGDGWYLLKKGFVLSLDKGRRVYVKTKDAEIKLKSGETVTLRGKIIGIKDFDNLVLERVD